MAIWPENKTRYEARLKVFKYFCDNLYRWCFQTEDAQHPAINFEIVNGWLPVEIHSLDYDDFCSVRDCAYYVFRNRYNIRVLDIDDILFKLNWYFHPEDIKEVKLQYKEPAKLRKRK